jgi:hypothetical protein
MLLQPRPRRKPRLARHGELRTGKRIARRKNLGVTATGKPRMKLANPLRGIRQPRGMVA